jgi:KipI family sensor histidine kinase inhibitor
MTGAGRILRCGEEALLVEVDGLAEVLDLAAAVRRAVSRGERGFERVVDVVPAATTVLVTVAEGSGLGRLPEALTGLDVVPGSGARTDPADAVEIDVRYDGPDLAEVASRTGLEPEEVVTAHTGTPWRVAFGGFAPGFAYLVGGDERLRVPRRSEPRTSVPAGAVALAGEFSAVYPRSSPGGWQLVGQTDAAMWDVDREPPALLQPGMLVRFVDVGSR